MRELQQCAQLTEERFARRGWVGAVARRRHRSDLGSSGERPATGADTPTWLATSPDVEGITGQFFVGRKQTTTASHTTDVARCDRLWDESARLVGLSPDL